MRHQQVAVDYWAMCRAMVTYGALTALVWLMLKLFHSAFMLPRRLRAQQRSAQLSLLELQRRFPDLNITEEDLKNAEKELDDLLKENEKEATEATESEAGESRPVEEDKKSI